MIAYVIFECSTGYCCGCSNRGRENAWELFQVQDLYMNYGPLYVQMTVKDVSGPSPFTLNGDRNCIYDLTR